MKYALTVAGMALAAMPASACSVCNLDPHSVTRRGANLAILVMLVFVGGVLAAISGIAYTWFKRAERLEAARASAR